MGRIKLSVMAFCHATNSSESLLFSGLFLKEEKKLTTALRSVLSKGHALLGIKLFKVRSFGMTFANSKLRFTLLLSFPGAWRRRTQLPFFS
jgi:hypothetical protein